MQWYKVVYVEIERGGMDQMEGYEIVEAESPEAAIEEVKRECAEVQASVHSFRAVLATEGEIKNRPQ